MGLEQLRDRLMCSHEFQAGFCVFGRVARKRCKIAGLTSPTFAALTSPPILLDLSFAFTFAPPQRMISRAGELQPGKDVMLH